MYEQGVLVSWSVKVNSVLIAKSMLQAYYSQSLGERMYRIGAAVSFACSTYGASFGDCYENSCDAYSNDYTHKMMIFSACSELAGIVFTQKAQRMNPNRPRLF